MSSGPYSDADDGDLHESSWEPLDFDSSTFGDAPSYGDAPAFGGFEPAGDLLPTRWDALGAPPAPLEIEAPILDAPLLDEALLDAPFGAPFSAPLSEAPLAPSVDAPPVTATVFEPLSIGDGSSTMYDDAYRVCFRLTGSRPLAHELTARAIRETATPGGPAGMVGAVMSAAVAGAIGIDDADADRVPYAQHRARLRRDLARHSERDRAILALRHLVGVPPVAVAARLGLHEGVVREVASEWWPEDGRGDSSALLRGIDSWINAESFDSDVVPGSEHLAHLDDLAPDT